MLTPVALAIPFCFAAAVALDRDCNFKASSRHGCGVGVPSNVQALGLVLRVVSCCSRLLRAGDDICAATLDTTDGYILP